MIKFLCLDWVFIVLRRRVYEIYLVHEIQSRFISGIMFMLPWMQIGPALSGIATKGVKIEKAP